MTYFIKKIIPFCLLFLGVDTDVLYEEEIDEEVVEFLLKVEEKVLDE